MIDKLYILLQLGIGILSILYGGRRIVYYTKRRNIKNYTKNISTSILVICLGSLIIAFITLGLAKPNKNIQIQSQTISVKIK